MKHRGIGEKMIRISVIMVFSAILIVGLISVGSLLRMRKISADLSRELGNMAAADAENALGDIAKANLLNIAMNKAEYIDVSLDAGISYVHGIADAAETIYANPDEYPDRIIEPPKKGITELSVQLLRSERLDGVSAPDNNELNKLGNLKELLMQYNKNNNMVSSIYVATKSGWMIQADYIADSKFMENGVDVAFYEASTRPWFQSAMLAEDNEVSSSLIRDVHGGGDGVVYSEPIYCDGEIVAVAGVGSYFDTIKSVILNTTIGESGYAFLMSDEGKILVSPKDTGYTASGIEDGYDVRKSNNKYFAEIAKAMTAGKSGVESLTLDGKEVFIAYAPLKSFGWSIATVMNVSEVMSPAYGSQRDILALTDAVTMKQGTSIKRTLLVFAVVLLVSMLVVSVFSMIFTRRITDPIKVLTSEVKKLGDGNLDHRIHITTGDEIEDLGNSFNDMAEQLQAYIKNLAMITAEKERIGTELKIATQIQADMLPNIFPAFPEQDEIDIYAMMSPAKEVGGDFYDFFMVDDTHLAVVMADVSGKGVPAALFMVIGKTLIKDHTKPGKPLGDVFTEVNQLLCESNREGLFITAFEGVLDLETGHMVYVNAGHEMPFITDHEGRYHIHKVVPGFVLAGMEGMQYTQGELEMVPGDRLFLYTDGATEATNTDNDMYGKKRIEAVLNQNSSMSPTELLHTVKADIDSFVGDAEQFDDITLLGMVYKKKLDLKPEKTDRLILTADVVELESLNSFINCFMDQCGCEEKVKGQIDIAVEEIFVNICSYAYEGSKGEVVIEAAQKEKRLILAFIDKGIPYNPLEKPDPDITLDANEREIGGLGIFIAKNIMDEMDYCYDDGQNRLTMTKKI